MSEKFAEFAGFGRVIVVFQGGKQKAFSKPAGTEKEQVFARAFDHRYMPSTVCIIIIACDNIIKITDTVREFNHGFFLSFSSGA
jgi:hypothetical protein